MKSQAKTQNGREDVKENQYWVEWIRILHRPMDPVSLAVTRILYGLLMMADIVQERGWSNVDAKWGSSTECRFPLWDFIKPLAVEWMQIIYLIMFLGAANICLGLFYRPSCLCFITTYSYIFLLDKTTWNNHSYLFGLLGFLMTIVDADRAWSLDGWRKRHISNCHVPFWNYAIIRAQIFLVYFIAGLKKMDSDWIKGYSVENLASHWIFDPIKFLVTDDVLNYYVIHLGGFFLDLTVGFLMMYRRTRTVAFTFCFFFHLLNSQIFSIGMFPYMMMATMPIFCSPDWPRRFVSAERPVPTRSDHCLYPLVPNSKTVGGSDKCSRRRFYHKFSAAYFIFYMFLQISLPYSHFITKGYNNWTNGLYGYSWDMMVHSWKSLHTRVTVHDNTTGKIHYLDPDKWTFGDRWTGHADMAVQYGRCVKENLKRHYGVEHDIEVHLDVWKSVNGRFQQRFFDPRVDILSYEWSPFGEVSFVMPLLTELSDWREKLQSLERQIFKGSEYMDVVFVADFPGLSLENFVSQDFSNTTLEVLSGEIQVDTYGTALLVSMKAGDKLQIPAGKFHTVHTVSSEPSSYMYLYMNTTERSRELSHGNSNTNSTSKDDRCPSTQNQHEGGKVSYVKFWKEKIHLFINCFKSTAKAIKKLLSTNPVYAFTCNFFNLCITIQ